MTKLEKITNFIADLEFLHPFDKYRIYARLEKTPETVLDLLLAKIEECEQKVAAVRQETDEQKLQATKDYAIKMQHARQKTWAEISDAVSAQDQKYAEEQLEQQLKQI